MSSSHASFRSTASASASPRFRCPAPPSRRPPSAGSSRPPPISAWGGAHNTYLATAGLANASVTASEGDPPDVLFGVQATVLPLTIWSGPQVLRLKLDLWTQKVIAVRPTTGET